MYFPILSKQVSIQTTVSLVIVKASLQKKAKQVAQRSSKPSSSYIHHEWFNKNSRFFFSVNMSFLIFFTRHITKKYTTWYTTVHANKARDGRTLTCAPQESATRRELHRRDCSPMIAADGLSLIVTRGYLRRHGDLYQNSKMPAPAMYVLFVYVYSAVVSRVAVVVVLLA